MSSADFLALSSDSKKIITNYIEEKDIPDYCDPLIVYFNELIEKKCKGKTPLKDFVEFTTLSQKVYYAFVNSDFRSHPEVSTLIKICIGFALNYSTTVRNIHVTYIDSTDVGLEYIYSHHPMDSICRITDYSRAYKKIFFNNYHGESVIIFDNFNSDIPVETFINYFRNGYPLSLPARGYNRTACFTDVYILSDHCPSSLYHLPHLDPSPDALLLMHYIDTYLSYDPFTHALSDHSGLA